MHLLKKISVKGVVNKPIDGIVAEAGDKLPVDIMEVYGIANKTFTGEGGVRGTYEGLKGHFEAVNLLDGEVFESFTLYLPGIGQDYVAAMLMEGDGKPVNIGVKVSVTRSAKSRLGYEYVITPLEASARSNKIASIRTRMGKGDSKGKTA